MSPSRLHEERVDILDQLSRLAGCTVRCTLGPGLLPDVLLAHASSRLLFLGEAKRSETPGNIETERRLRRYLRAVRPLQRHGYAIRLAVCGDRSEAAKWSKLLSRLAASERLAVSVSGSADVGCAERVVWLDLLPTGSLLASPRSSLQPVSRRLPDPRAPRHG